MKFQLKLFLFIFCSVFSLVAYSQVPETIKTESSTPAETPLDDIVERTINVEKRVLKYDNPREADLMWEKRVWRVIDLREKMNSGGKRKFSNEFILANYIRQNPQRLYAEISNDTDMI